MRQLQPLTSAARQIVQGRLPVLKAGLHHANYIQPDAETTNAHMEPTLPVRDVLIRPHRHLFQPDRLTQQLLLRLSPLQEHVKPEREEQVFQTAAVMRLTLA